MALIGGWTLAAYRQPEGFDSTVDTISALAAIGAADRWLMSLALVVVGVCHVVTALGLTWVATPGRIVLGLGGVATALVAAFPLPMAGHGVVAAAAFGALAVWPAFDRRRGEPVLAAAVLLGLVGWFAVSLVTATHVGLAERVAAGAQALWPLVVVVTGRRPERPR
ncbi:DUF998 domain-containing protein [Actinoplanes couchii]|uniref:Integral membrane protein n=1 Tax=Actinoplanes couchii TaxID=403638 RepID=A0ABQ3XLG9_9ACTN|nr:DUF998 domain-containing protein [Actinoplanes couchii]MDR6318282.1 putative membrane protein [Actinoplanes couchii]GID59348.1 hypothetical protein Aco03nite_077520 [Actinoplanes couchii]